MPNCNVYIDGFNLYYRAVKGTAYKWLDLAGLASAYAPAGYTIKQIRYYTALIKSVGDPDAPVRQQVYLRALRTIPNLSITYGHFLTQPKLMPLRTPPPTGSRFVWVIRTDEKGSDVNLASHLLLDAFKKDCEAAMVVSNDSDLLEPVRIARRDFGINVGILCPTHPVAVVLGREANFVKYIRSGALAANQFPATMTDAAGTFTKPAAW
jgi:uncharacterized LabA/DUF88 family protein